MSNPRVLRSTRATTGARPAPAAHDPVTGLPTTAQATEARRASDGPLATLRAAFLAAVARDTPGSDLARYTVVLDDLLAWAAARVDRVVAAPAAGTLGGIAFGPGTGSTGPRWCIRPVRGEGPVVEVLPSSGVAHEATRERVRALFNAHSRAVLGPEARLRIGFGALKNPAARAALLALLDELLGGTAAPTLGA
ncbi:hypothetical protein [Roseisolibacter sp. H3M3-2]|uniref:hypothetical protein n=1 Tax=Roseisolibacter sp. H3M3-2 TaxID=3031323 RepID=UPI0023D9DE95|nr:hypothetical protein [Roseisolibacter sp. H3M3-2]MDF1501371.1 hypothetical protein [Roseisolibacter sp. H3M3-2]